MTLARFLRSRSALRTICRHTSELTLRVPPRLVIRVEHARRSTVEGVAGVRLENLVGDVQVRSVAGEVTGSHRNGALGISAAGAVRLTLVGVTAVIAGTRGEVAVTSRNGQSRFEHTQGAIALDVNNETVTIADSAAAVRVERDRRGGDRRATPTGRSCRRASHARRDSRSMLRRPPRCGPRMRRSPFGSRASCR